MKHQRVRRFAAVGVPVAAMALILAACSSNNGGGGSGGGSSGSGTLNGSGSTFQLTFQQTAIQNFKSIEPNLTVNYGGGPPPKWRGHPAPKCVPEPPAATPPIPPHGRPSR